MIVWRMEERIAAARRRLFLFNVVVPLVLVAPIALSAAPAPHAAAAYTVLFALFGVLGSAVPLVRDGERGLLLRIQMTGLSARRYLGERTMAGTVLDILQLLPAVAVVVVASDAGAGLLGLLVAVAAGALLLGNALGVWIAALARSIAEAALLGAVLTLLILHGAGVFRTPLPGSGWAVVEHYVPLRALHESLLGAVGGGAAPPPSMVLLSLLGGGATLLLTFLFAPLLLRRLALP